MGHHAGGEKEGPKGRQEVSMIQDDAERLYNKIENPQRKITLGLQFVK